MTIQEQVPAVEAEQQTTETNSGFVHKLKSLGRKATAKAVEAPEDYYFDGPFTD